MPFPRKPAALKIGVFIESVVHGRLVRNAITELDDVSVHIFQDAEQFSAFLDTESKILAIVDKKNLPLLTGSLLERIKSGELPTLVTAQQMTMDEGVAVIDAGVGEIVLFPTGHEKVSEKVNALLEETDYQIRPVF